MGVRKLAPKGITTEESVEMSRYGIDRYIIKHDFLL